MPRKPWFPHDLDASGDPKLVILAMERGFCAVGRWWNLVELFLGQDGYRMEVDAMTPAMLAKRWTTPVEPCTPTEAMDLMEALVTRYKLLKRDHAHVWSDSLIRRMDEYNAALNRFRKAGQVSAEARREKYGSSSPKRLPNVVHNPMNVVHPDDERRMNDVQHSMNPSFLPSSLPRGESLNSSPPLEGPTAPPVYVGAGGATDGASAPPAESPAAEADPERPEPMRPEHLATLEARAATGDRFALEALRRARHDGRLPHLPRPAAGDSTPAPASPPPDDDWEDDPAVEVSR